jgi:hypothetical protein
MVVAGFVPLMIVPGMALPLSAIHARRERLTVFRGEFPYRNSYGVCK